MKINNFRKLNIFLIIFAIVIFLFWRFQLGLVRYFDIDEFAHLHWGYSLYAGERPYLDFFYIFPPFFLYFVFFVIFLFGRTISAVLEARTFIFFVFLATCLVFFLIAKKMRGIFFAFLAILIFVFLPLPSDKMLEIRPDLVATCFSLFGLYFLILALVKGKTNKIYKKKKWMHFLSGAVYAVSLGFVSKTIFFLLPATLVVGLSHLAKTEEKEKHGLYFLGGIFLVGVVLFFLLLSYGNFFLGFLSMTKTASQTTAVLGSKFFISPNNFFYPNQTYYGIGGYSLPYLLNLIIYFSALLWAIHRLISFNLWEEKEKRTGEFLIGASFFANLFAFVYFYPLKHAQYLIPLAPFVSFYFADLVISLASRIKSIWGKEVILTGLVLMIVLTGKEMYEEKFNWTNKATLEKLAKILAAVPKEEPIFDLTGESVFFRNGYYFCCLPYGQYEEAFSFPLPDLQKEIERRKTNYVFVGQEGRLSVIPFFQAKYIKENFVPAEIESGLWRKKL